MPAIGYVTRTEDGSFNGQLKTLSIPGVDIQIVPNDHKANDRQPDYRVTAGDIEVGAGWNRRSESSGNEYVSLALAAPEFGPRRLYANLGRVPRCERRALRDHLESGRLTRPRPAAQAAGR